MSYLNSFSLFSHCEPVRAPACRQAGSNPFQKRLLRTHFPLINFLGEASTVLIFFMKSFKKNKYVASRLTGSKAPRNDNNMFHGFTLVELLLALSIFSVIALSLYGTFATGINLTKRSEKTDEVYRQVRWTLEKISAELENMVNYDFSNSYPTRLAFIGEGDKIAFIVPSDKGLKVVRYYLQPLEFGSVHKTIIGKHFSRNVDMIFLNEKEAALEAFVREEVGFVEDLSSETPESREVSVLNSNIKKDGLKFSFAYQEEGANEEIKVIWKDRWDQKGIPSGIQVELTCVDADKKENVSVKKNIFVPTGRLGETKL